MKSPLREIHFREALDIVRRVGFIRHRNLFILLLYYLLAFGNAVLDGCSMVLLVNLLIGELSFQEPNLILRFSMNLLHQFGWDVTSRTLLFLVVSLFGVRVLFYFMLTALDGVFWARIRRRIQNRGFASLVLGDWEILRDIRVGQKVGALTEEAVIATKYFTSAIRLVYFVMTSIVLIAISLIMHTELTLVMSVIGIPIILGLKLVFVAQARLSARQMEQRQGMAADFTERLSGLFQIKVTRAPDHYIQDGLKNQQQLTVTETISGYLQAVAVAIEIAMPAIVLLFFYFWTVVTHRPFTSFMHILAGIAAVGMRTMSQISGVIGSWGNLSRLSGSLPPIVEILKIRPEPTFKTVDEPLAGVELKRVSYAYNGGRKLPVITCRLNKNQPLVVQGASGAGKTTLANLIAGIYRPTEGEVGYIGASGRFYNSRAYKVHVGYVTQDVYLFHGTIRNNLNGPAESRSDEELWCCLEKAGAADFVRVMGGLDAIVVENGRSLSGGEKRRLSIARVLLSKPDILIFDEITAGLDEENKQLIFEAVLKTMRESIAAVITHDNIFSSIENRLMLE